MLTNMFEKYTKVEEMLWRFSQCFDSFYQRGNSQPLNSVLDEFVDELALTLKNVFVNIADKRIDHLFEVDDDFVQ